MENFYNLTSVTPLNVFKYTLFYRNFQIFKCEWPGSKRVYNEIVAYNCVCIINYNIRIIMKFKCLKSVQSCLLYSS